MTSVFVASSTACGAAGAGGASGQGDDTLTFAAVVAQRTLDPDLMPVRQMAMYAAPVYDSLTVLDGDETVQPMLATEWAAGVDDRGPYLDLTLREGLAFDDGTPFTSRTVAVNITRSQELAGSTNAAGLAGVTVEEIDETHVRLRSARGVGALPRVLAGPTGMMISDRAIAEKRDLTHTEAGIGAFDLESVQPNRVVYTANEDYWDESAAATRTLEITYLADDAKLNAVRSGTVDITILPEDMTEPAEDAGYAIERSLGAQNYTFSLNTELEPFDDPKVRQAVNMAVDRKAICAGLLDGHCEPTGQIFGAGSGAYGEATGFGDFPFDPERARQLIDEAGAAGAKTDIVTVAGNQTFEQLATVFQDQLEDIGLDADVQPVAPPQVVSRFTVEKNAAIAFGAVGNAFDPSQSLRRYVLPTGLYNPGRFRLAKIDELAAAALRETDQEKRMEIYREISGLVDASGFVVPVMTPQTAYVIGRHVTGWEMPWAPSFPSFRGVSG